MKRSLLFVMLLCAAVAWGDDGLMLRRDLSKTPDEHTEHAAMTMLELYVPAQSSSGEAVTITYELNPDATGTQPVNRTYAKPLIAFYQDGHGEEVEGTPFMHGERDAFAAVSLDDGLTWKRTNLSNSADRSSFKIKLAGRKKIPYPGDVVRLFTGSAGNKALLVWASRYCEGGSPTYALDQEELDLLEEIVGADDESCQQIDPQNDEFSFDENLCLYFEDLWGVSGSQGSSDFADEGFPEIGEVPYSCMWAARGTLETVDETGKYNPSGTLYGMVWRKAERLTSGRRDANRMEVHCEAGAGCVVTWQEDPEGLRPGEGEGPGEGFSGAIAHHETDTWYSYISWDTFDLVDDEADDLLGVHVTLEERFDGGIVDGAPQVGVPMSIPVRLTDNAMCRNEDGITDPSEWNQNHELHDDPYCYMDFDGSDTTDICAEWRDINIEIPVPGSPPLTTQDIVLAVCVTEDGRLMRGNTASTRPRTNLRGYDSDGDGVYDGAWVLVAYEENKGLGEEQVLAAEAAGLDPSDTIDMTKVDMGKNIWYHTFDMKNPELVSQGMILNQPALYPAGEYEINNLTPEAFTDDYEFMVFDADPIYVDQAGFDAAYTILYQTEIARRFSLISQDYTDVGDSGTVAFAMWKQGIIRRGGPADVMARRFVIPVGFDPATDNPYDYANMVCDKRIFDDGSNPRYVKGLCLDLAIALSATTIVEGDCGTDEQICRDAFPFSDYFDDLDMTKLNDDEQLSKIQEWRWCESILTSFNYTIDSLNNPSFICPDGDLDDTSWDNPYDVAKGHRGYMDGDFIMALYAWSPNWMANTVGHDNYNLYVRRSFDGGQTWTTTPASFTHNDGVDYTGNGTTTCEWMTLDSCSDGNPPTTSGECPVCVTYVAGDFEQARNLSQLVGTGETILDPRYSPTRPDIAELLPDGTTAIGETYEDSIRDPSRFFMVYETGDNTTVALGEAEPLDLYYSRAVGWGDNYLVWADETDLDACYPASDLEATFELTDFCNEFDALEGFHDALSGEASVTANPGGTQFYAVWNQEDLDGSHEEVIASDAWFRRVAFYDDVTVDPMTLGGGTDRDLDGYFAEVDDCNDGNPSIHPGATDLCEDGIDQDCDGIDPICDPPPSCWPKGTPCDASTALECCSGMCHPVKHTCK